MLSVSKGGKKPASGRAFNLIATFARLNLRQPEIGSRDHLSILSRVVAQVASTRNSSIGDKFFITLSVVVCFVLFLVAFGKF